MFSVVRAASYSALRPIRETEEGTYPFHCAFSPAKREVGWDLSFCFFLVGFLVTYNWPKTKTFSN
jgi:hypothetical protein